MLRLRHVTIDDQKLFFPKFSQNCMLARFSRTALLSEFIQVAVVCLRRGERAQEEVAFMIATDVAARGLDISGVEVSPPTFKPNLLHSKFR